MLPTFKSLRNIGAIALAVNGYSSLTPAMPAQGEAAAANAMIVAAAAYWISFFREGTPDESSSVAGWLRAGRGLHAAFVGVGAAGLLVVFGFFNLLGRHLPG